MNMSTGLPKKLSSSSYHYQPMSHETLVLSQKLPRKALTLTLYPIYTISNSTHINCDVRCATARESTRTRETTRDEHEARDKAQQAFSTPTRHTHRIASVRGQGRVREGERGGGESERERGRVRESMCTGVPPRDRIGRATSA
jgi:hypothetical protein